MAGTGFKIQEVCFFIFADWLFHLVQRLRLRKQSK